MSDLLGPQQIVLVTARAEIEQLGRKKIKDDIETVFWHMPVSKEELIYAVAIENHKHILGLINESGVFCINFLGLDMLDSVKRCSSMHGEHIDKFSEIGFRKTEAQSIECPFIKEACAHMDCQVMQTIDFKDTTVLIAKIINSEVKYQVKRLFQLNNNYTTTKD